MLERAQKVRASWFDGYADTLRALLRDAVATDGSGQSLPVDSLISWAVKSARAAHQAGNKLMFVGNGGSAAIASHMATDYNKNGNLRALAFNDGSILTCLANDYGYEHVFAK